MKSGCQPVSDTLKQNKLKSERMIQMANNNFNTAEFLRGAYFSPITVGQHKVKLGKLKTVIDSKEDGSDASYLLVPMTFSNGRKVDTRFYGLGAKICCDQLRQQLEDTTDYKKLSDFLKTLEDKEVDMWVSKRTYASTDGTPKTTLQYDFIAPVEETEEEPTVNPFG